MKPAFALDFRNDAIALLHRSSGGWHQVGRVTFDEPDLPAALSYLRATALGLSPRGLATKLILPDDQILVTTVDAPGPDEASRMAQIRAALEGRTPYAVEDLVFDWQEINGTVHVAVIARETLAEAEGFAAEHRFNPVSFTAGPQEGFTAEPGFGLTAGAADILAAGESVERDDLPVMILARAAVIEASPASDASDQNADGAQGPDPEDSPEAMAATEVPGSEDPHSEADADAAPDLALSEPEPEPEPEPQEQPAPEPAWQRADEPMRASPVFGLADDESPPSVAFRPDSLPTEPAPVDLDDHRPDDTGVMLQDQPPEEEAPMAVDVEDEAGLRASPAQEDQPFAKKPVITDPSIADDAPPASGFSPVMGFASRRSSADAGLAGKIQPPPPRQIVERPTAARPLVAPPAPKGERPALNRPTAARPVAPKESKGLRGLGALVTAPGIPGSRKKKGLAPSADPTETIAPANPTANGQTVSNTPGAGLDRSFGNRPAPMRGKPRHLGLILTAILLLILALVAAWSTSLAFRTNDGSTTEVAASQAPAEEPAIEDEMLADGVDPEAAVDAEVARAPEPEPDPQAAAPEAAPSVATSDMTAAAPTANPGATSGDEIFLAAKDLAPVAPDPIDLPDLVAQGDPLPNAQAPPPPFGTVYQFDANGLIVPTPEGIVTPEGVLLVAGKPPLVPKPRPAASTHPAAEPPAAEPSAAATTLPATDATEAAFPSDPALARFRPQPRPEGLTPPAAAAPVAPLPDDAALPFPAADSRLAGKRPQARSEAVLAVGEAARAANAAAAASLAAQAEAAAALTSKLAVAISRKPEPRPRDLSRAVEAAVAAAVRAPEPKPEPEPEPQPEPEQLASAQPAKSPQPKAKPEEKEETADKAATKTMTRGKDAEVEADDEPEVEASAPRAAPSGSVAKQATFKNALNLEKTALIGVYGTQSKRYAMIRSSNGRYKKVKIGDSIDGGKIKAITATEVRYQKGSKLVTLSLPKG